MWSLLPDLGGTRFHHQTQTSEGIPPVLPRFVIRAWSSVLRGLLFSHAIYFFHKSTYDQIHRYHLSLCCKNLYMYEEHFSSYFNNFKVKDFGWDLLFKVYTSFCLIEFIWFKWKLYIKMMSRSQPSVLLNKIGLTTILMTFTINIYLLGLIWVILRGHWGEILVEAPCNSLILFGHPPGIDILSTPVLCHLFGN